MKNHRYKEILLLVSGIALLSCQPFIRTNYWGDIHESKGTDHSIAVTREIKTRSDSILIATAENYLSAEKRIFRNQTYPWEPETLWTSWWYETNTDVKIPWAITGEAVKYYINFVTNCIHPHLTFSGRLNPEMSGIVYHATVNKYGCYTQYQWRTSKGELLIKDTLLVMFHLDDTLRWSTLSDSFNNVTVVSMMLKFHCLWSPMAALHFIKERIVIFDERENIIKVYGDGETSIIVS